MPSLCETAYPDHTTRLATRARDSGPGPSVLRTFKLTVAYDGTDYAGWQRQAGVDTVQARLEAAVAEIEGRDVTVHGAGRTDAGVHAWGQVATVELEHRIDTPALGRALNAKLPGRHSGTGRGNGAAVIPRAFRGASQVIPISHQPGLTVANPMERRFCLASSSEAMDLERDASRPATAISSVSTTFAAFQTAASDATVSTTDSHGFRSQESFQSRMRLLRDRRRW